MYTAGFLTSWVLLSAFVVHECYLEQHGKTRNDVISIYWTFALVMVVFQGLRPIGLARDDLAYIRIFNDICPTLECGLWIQSPRDWGWYSLIGLLKSVSNTPRVMLWLGAFALFIKLIVIYALSRRPLPALLLFAGVYYQVQDLTAWRVSLASAIFMVAIWVYVRGKTYVCAILMLICGVFHKQAFVTPLVLLGQLLQKRMWLFAGLTIVPVTLLVCGAYPELQHWLPNVSNGVASLALKQGLDSHMGAKLAGLYQGWRVAPIVTYPLIILILWLLLANWQNKDRLESIMSGCLIIGCLFLWGFASLPDAQVRFFEFFLMPTILLAGQRRLTFVETAGVIVVSGIFVVKYNILANLFLGA